MNRFCEDCYEKYKEKHRLNDKREQILVAGQGVKTELLEPGDEANYPATFSKVSILYEMRILGKTPVVDSTATRGGRPIWFESGCSGACLHVQILGANRIYQASVLDVSVFQCFTPRAVVQPETQVPDPYCIVYWEDILVGATQVIDGNTNPVWTGETFVLPLANPTMHWMESAALRGNQRLQTHPKYSEPLLRMELYDYNTLFKDVFVGQVSLSPQKIVKVLAGSEPEPRVYPVQPRMSSGTMHVTIGRTTHTKTGVVHIVVRVDGCSKLPTGETFRKTDPYIIAFWDGKCLGESPVIYNNLEPSWDDCIFHFPVPNCTKPGLSLKALVDMLGIKTLRIEVRDNDQVGGKHKVLGEIELHGKAISGLVKRSDQAAMATTHRDLPRGTLKSVVLVRTNYAASMAAVIWLLRAVICIFCNMESIKQDNGPNPRGGTTTPTSVSVRQLKNIVFAQPLDIPLILSDKHNGKQRAQGSLGTRIIYHTRGKIIRGIDVGVQQMSLGERARLTIRSDYAFDTVRPGPKIPPGSELEVIVDLVSIAGRSLWITYFKRAIIGKCRIYQNKLYVIWDRFQDRAPVPARYLKRIGKLAYCGYAIFLRCLCLLIFCVCKACTKIGRRNRMEIREQRRKQREDSILARAESGIPFLHIDSEDETQVESTCEEGRGDAQSTDLMDTDDTPIGADEIGHQLEISGARGLFSRK